MGVEWGKDPIPKKGPTPLDLVGVRKVPEDKWRSFPLSRGDIWIRNADGVHVTVVKRVGGQIRYRFENGGSMVTKLSRFTRKYRPLSPATGA